MKASQLIKALELGIQEYGDRDVRAESSSDFYNIEICAKNNDNPYGDIFLISPEGRHEDLEEIYDLMKGMK